MSAQLAGSANAALSNHFNASLELGGGVSAHISAPSLDQLASVVKILQPAQPAANDGGNAKGKPAVTAAAGTPATPPAAPSAPSAAGAAAQGDAGNGTGASAGAPTASSNAGGESSLPTDPAEAFGVVKKAFLALSTKENGRAKCEGVLKPFGLAKLSDAKPEQYATVLAEIQKASA